MDKQIKNKIFRVLPVLLIVSLVMSGTLIGIYLWEIINNPLAIILPFVLSTVGLVISVILISKFARKIME